MTGNEPDNESLDPSTVAAQAASLADHLARSGVQWLPKPRADHVTALQQRMSAYESQPQAAEGNSGPDHALQATSPSSRTAAGSAELPPRTLLDGIDSTPDRTGSLPGSSRRTTPTSTPQRLMPVASVTSFEGPYPGESLSAEDRQLRLDQLANVVSTCHRCAVLSSCRHHTVFGEGSVTPRIVFFGEGPGADEDRSGRPFVGKAGQLLTKMIEACKFRRSDAYILNTVKCRPPENRNPEPDEITNCREYYQQQLAILRPEYIVCLGAVSGQELLQSKLSVGRLRGRFHQYFESKVLVTYHPAYLLRNPSAKKAAWEDLQIMLRDAKIEY